MSVKKILFPPVPSSHLTSTLLLVTRIIFGLLFLSHGYAKLMSFESLSDVYADPLGLGSTLSLWLTVFAEVLCSFALILGILQRLVLIPMIITMAVAFFIVHGNDVFAIKELSFIYMIVFILLYIAGPGHYSFDAIIRKLILKNSES
ncbi:MAG: DoxX family protein [Bacteroidales bacterium]|nr:DoxX family protein [Bacteroidales bacterium]